MNTGNDNIPGTATAAVAPVRKAAAANEEHNSGHKNISSNKLNNNNLKINTESVAKGNAITPNTTGSTANTAAGNKHTATANKKVNAKIVPAAGNNVVKDMAVATTVKPKDISKGAAHDSIPSISLKEKLVVDPRAGKAHYERDTVGTGMAVLPVTAPVQRPANSIPSAENNYNNPRYVASAAENPNVQTEPTEPQILPAAAMKTTATASKETGLVAAHKARRSHEGWNFAAVSQFLQDAKHSLGQIQTSTGLIVGINTVFLTGGMVPGIQLGATETLGISDRIAVMLELKYHQSFNRGVELKDNYVSYTEESKDVYRRDSVEQIYKFSALQSFTLPVTVQYHAGNFNIFAGGSFVYTLGINPELAGGPLLDYRKTGLTNVPQETIDAAHATINQSDFNSRFGLGYIFGASYQVSPKMSVDARMTQTFWDNAATPGAKIVSDRLYKKPGVQLSIGYNLSKEKKH
jgi:opacity protein-like surface antigen